MSLRNSTVRPRRMPAQRIGIGKRLAGLTMKVVLAITGTGIVSSLPIDVATAAPAPAQKPTLPAPAVPALPALPALPAPIQALVARGMVVIKDFPAKAGLTGWVLTKQGRSAIVYTTPDGHYLVVGSLIDASGQDLTSVYAATYVPKPDPASLYQRLDSARYITEGAASSTHVIYVFFDPNCVFCHFAWKALQPYIDAGLQARWIPVGFLKPTSVPRAAAILEAKVPAQALEFNERQFVAATEDGGIAPLPSARPETLRAVAANNALMNAFGGNGTPTFAWKDNRGVVQARSGMPPLSELSAITGLPVQPQTDRSLDRFR